MSKVTKKKLQADHNKLLNQFAELVRSLKSSKVISEETCPTFYRRTTEIVDDTCEQAEPKLKVLDQSVFDGLDEKWQFAAVDRDGEVFIFDSKAELLSECWDVMDGDECEKIKGNYDASNWQNSLIERYIAKELLEVDLSSELTGSDLCRKMLARGDSRVVCLVSNISDKQAVDYREHTLLIEGFAILGGFWGSRGTDYKHAVPVSPATNEPLTAADVGL